MIDLIPQPEEPFRLRNFIKSLGAYRDGLLVAVSLTYSLGYVLWALYAWYHNLGLLPALDAQYFSAGLFLIPGLCVLIVSIVKIKLGKNRWRTWQHQKRRRIYFTWVLILVLPASFIIFSFKRPFNWQNSPVYLILGLIMLWVLLQAPIERPGHPRAASLNPIWLWSYIAILVFVFGRLTFAVFLLLPQEFGGPHPRCALLDIDAQQISKQTRNEIFPGDETNSNNHTIRSEKVEVLFSGSDFLLVRLEGFQDRIHQLLTPRIPTATLPKVWVELTKGPSAYEIKRDIVKAISWCDK